jgi:Flp pilus assembly pilin Flp
MQSSFSDTISGCQPSSAERGNASEASARVAGSIGYPVDPSIPAPGVRDARSQEEAQMYRLYTWDRRFKLQRGQNLVEYSLIILFVAIAVIGALALIGPVLGSIFSNVKPAL